MDPKSLKLLPWHSRYFAYSAWWNVTMEGWVLNYLITKHLSACYLLLNLSLHSVGAGVGPTIQIGEQTVITVDAKHAGKGKVTCTVCTPDGGEVDVDVVENEDGTFDIFYTAPQPGKYVICVRFGGELIPNSPFQVTVHICHTDPLCSYGALFIHFKCWTLKGKSFQWDSVKYTRWTFSAKPSLQCEWIHSLFLHLRCR